MIRFIPDSPSFSWAYRPIEPPPQHIAEACIQYDPSIRLRFNRLLDRWEVWFLRQGFAHQEMTDLSPEEVSNQARFWFAVQDADGNGLPLDKRDVMRAIHDADWWRRHGGTAKEAEFILAQQDHDQKKAVHTEALTELQDYIVDHKNQLYPLQDLHSPEHMKLIRKGL